MALGNVFVEIDSAVDEALESVGIGVKPPLNPYMKKAKEVATKFMEKPWMYGWMWQVELDVEGVPEDFDLYVKDLDYGDGSIDTDVIVVGSGSIAIPTYSNAGEVTMTVRDDADETISNFIDDRIAKVKNKDGTVNLPVDYVFAMKVRTLNEDGEPGAPKTMLVYPIKKGNKSWSREAGNTIFSYPVIFQKFTTLDITP